MDERSFDEWVDVSRYGSDEHDEKAAREFVEQYVPREGVTAKLVARRVLTGPWGERNG